MKHIAAFLCVAVFVWIAAGRFSAPPTHSNQISSTLIRSPYDPTLTDRTLADYAASVKNSPQNAIGYHLLSECYLRRCRETGDLGDAIRAEQAARKSLEIRTNNNQAAAHALAQTLIVQHKFREGYKTLKDFGLISPNSGSATLAVEILIELGDYAGAAKTFNDVVTDRTGVGSKVAQARLSEINGHTDRAISLLREAEFKTDRNYDMPHESAAWFHLREGDLLSLAGKPNEAEAAYKTALSIFPKDFKAMTGLAKLAAGKEDWSSVLIWGRQAAEIVPAPEIVSLLGDAYLATGKTKEAEEQFQLIEAMGRISRSNGTVFDRQRAIFCADHNRNLDEALSLARRELDLRKDIYAYDTLAWVCYKKGLLLEADKMMQKALGQGAQDAKLYFHAGMIANALGNKMEAKRQLRQSLELNPHFLPFAPQQARTTLAQL